LHQNLENKIYNQEETKNVKDIASEIELEEYKRQVDQIEGVNLTQTKWLNATKLAALFFVIMLITLLLLLRSMRRNVKLREKSNQELLVANLALQKAKEEADNSNMLKTQFVSTITHELRTPLYGVVGITNIIIEEHKELANSPHLNSLKFSAGYLLSLVNDLLQINKIEENRITLESMIFNLPDEIKTIVDSLQFIARKNINKLIIEIDTDIPESLIGDKLRLSQVFMNLISNALKFTKNGEVKIVADLVRTEGTKRFIKFQVIDTGVGIAKEDQLKVFEKFVQIERKEGDYQGTGLGLSIVKKLVEIFGGQIEIESEEGIGTNFFFTIGFEADEKQKIEIINNIVVDLSSNYNYNVLVVEDNKINQIVTKKTLETNQFKCTVVDDGYAALDLLETEKFDIILMDINMPIINGFETSKLIRKKGIKTPIIALTAFDKQEVVEQVLASGMNDIIIKPFEKSKLFQVIAGLVNTSETN
jgi:signal transduction histidine kinase/ActR/RegA family two-component response regulator